MRMRLVNSKFMLALGLGLALCFMEQSWAGRASLCIQDYHQAKKACAPAEEQVGGQPCVMAKAYSNLPSQLSEKQKKNKDQNLSNLRFAENLIQACMEKQSDIQRECQQRAESCAQACAGETKSARYEVTKAKTLGKTPHPAYLQLLPYLKQASSLCENMKYVPQQINQQASRLKQTLESVQNSLATMEPLPQEGNRLPASLPAVPVDKTGSMR